MHHPLNVTPTDLLAAEGRQPCLRLAADKPVEQLLAEARQLAPPAEQRDGRNVELVDLATLDPTLKLDIRYASSDNVLGTQLYSTARALLQRPAAEAIVTAHRELMDSGYGLVVYDAYRPWHVTKVLWDATPAAQRQFVANPALGSRHNRGCAVDVGLFDVASGEKLEMPCPFDEFTERAHITFAGCSAAAKANRDRLRTIMEQNGFRVYEAEWWHYDHCDWAHYPILNVDLHDL